MFRVRNLVNTTTTTTTTCTTTTIHTCMCMCMWPSESGTQKEGEHNEKREGFKKRNEKREEKEIQKKRSTGPSRVVPHRSTTPAQTCLTSLFGWEAVSQADVAALNPKEENQYRLTSPSLQLSAAAPHRSSGSQLSLGSDPTVDRALCDRTLLWGHFRSDGTPRGTPPPLDMGRRDGHPN